MNKNTFRKKGIKNYIEVKSRWEKFSNFCERIKEELGETLYEVCSPIEEEGRIYVMIPDSNKNRITLAVTNYCGTEVGTKKLFS